ncbi:MAG TPA: aminotransferase class I/II-fold pyridoxal phosphate-dependent enzyme [Solirubrobacteraceae bacterium]
MNARETILSPTLEINERIARRQAQGLPTTPLGFGEAGLPVLEEVAHQLSAGAGHADYGPVAGIAPLREAAAGYWNRRGVPTDPEMIIAGPGSKPLLYALLQAISAPIALPRPSWVSYAAQAALTGCPAHMIATRPGQGGVPDPEQLDAAAERAQATGAPLGAVILTLPDNPTGTLADPSTVSEVCDVAERRDLLVISDEIYRDLVHDPKAPFLSPRSASGTGPWSQPG